MQSNYSLSGLLAQTFPVKGQGQLATVFRHVTCSLSLLITDNVTSHNSRSGDHKTVAAEVEKLEYESSGLEVSDVREVSQLPLTTVPQLETSEMGAVLFWRLAETVASTASSRATKCLQDVL